jgi:CRISPR-associated protein Cas2
MRRQRHLIAYDIRDAKRLRKVHRLMQGHGMPVQYSVFVCDLTALERFQLQSALYDVVDAAVDCLAFIELGPTDTSKFQFIGPRPAFPEAGAQIL